ncbi:MAG: copper homeostasis protein CutC [Planctomycetota bacterium]|nr:copper homeostasis protein CutC [Planctomycetota bacterium]
MSGRENDTTAAGTGAVPDAGPRAKRGAAPARAARIEVAVDSVEDALAAFDAGADRVELCARLETNGVTPDLADVRRVVAAGRGPLAVMLRERADSYRASAREVDAMAASARAFSAAGAARLVFGVVADSGEIDPRACGAIVAACGGATPVFHRVFDALADWRGAIETLVSLGFGGLLASGGQSVRAPGATDRLRAVRGAIGGRLDLLPGGGVRADNARAVREASGSDWLHTSARDAHGRFSPGVLRALREAVAE